MSDRDRIRAEAFVEAMLALGVREMTVRPAHLVDLHAYEITATADPAAGGMRFAIRRPVDYTVRLRHHWDDRLEVFVEDVSDDERSRLSVADALERATAMMRDPANTTERV